MIETATQKYRRIQAAQQNVEEQLFDFVSPSGMEWKLRAADINLFMVNGVMPVDLAAKAVKMEGKSELEIAQSMDVKDYFKSMSFVRKVIQFVTVDPHIVEEASEPNEISAEDVSLTDTLAIFKWAMPGGGRAEGLESFH